MNYPYFTIITACSIHCLASYTPGRCYQGTGYFVFDGGINHIQEICFLKNLMSRGKIKTAPFINSSEYSNPCSQAVWSTFRLDIVRKTSMSATQGRKEEMPSPSSIKKPQRRWQLIRIGAMRFILLIICLAGFLFSVVPWGRAFWRSTLILPALVTFESSPPLQYLGNTVKRSELEIETLSGTAYLNMFEPDAPDPLAPGAHGGLLVVTGVGEARDVPQLLNFLEAMARTGLSVMHVTAPILLRNDLSVDDTDAVVKAFETFEHRPGMSGKRIGMLAFSAGVPVVSFAAADPRIRERVASVTAFGGHFQTLSFVQAIGRRAVDVDGKTEPWHPNEIPLQILVNMASRHLFSLDTSLLIQAFFDKIALTEQQIERLSPPGRAIYMVLAGLEPDRVDANIAQFPAALRAEFEELSPGRVVDSIQAPVFLVHDRYDTSIPFTESRAFAASLAEHQHTYRHVEFQIFDHVQIREELSLWDLLYEGSRLFGILTDVFYNNA